MIKLTKCQCVAGEVRPCGEIWLAPSHIQVIELVEVAAGVFLTEVGCANRTRTVIETPEEIMAMPEMVYLANPVMFISNPPLPHIGGPVDWGRVKIGS